MPIGDHIRDLRWGRRLKQGELAQRAGIAQNTLSQIELGKTTPSVPTLEKIARGLTLDLSELLLEEPVPLAKAPKAGRPSVIDVALDAARRQIALEQQAMFGGRSGPMLDQRHANEAMQRLREEYGLEGNDAEAAVDFVLKAARLEEENATLRDRLQEREQAHS
jgi:transcriptional regulator with XRE-family HTH domain